MSKKSDALMRFFSEIRAFSQSQINFNIRGVFLGAILLGLMIPFHELGHYLWDRIVTKIPSRFVFTRIEGHWAFGVQATLPPSRYPDFRNNPDKYMRDRLLSRFAGILAVLPAYLFLLIFPEHALIFFILGLGSMLYTFWETFYYHRNHPWLSLLNSCENDT